MKGRSCIEYVFGALLVLHEGSIPEGCNLQIFAQPLIWVFFYPKEEMH